MNPYFESLKAHIKANPPNFGDGESVLTMLYECYNENNPGGFQQSISTDDRHAVARDGSNCLPGLQALPGSREGRIYRRNSLGCSLGTGTG